MKILAASDNGHFVDRTVGKLTDLKTGDQVADAAAVTIEYLALALIFVLPAILLISGFRGRKLFSVAAGGIGLIFVIWYRAIEDWDQRQNSILDKWNIPVGDWVEQVTIWVDLNMKETLALIKWPFQTMMQVIVDQWLLGLSWLTVCLITFFVGWAFRGLQVAAGSFLGLTICGLLGDEYWKETARTIGFIAVAVILCVLIGIPIGVACGRLDGVWRVVRPILDAMQVVHSFVYMLPFVFFFGVGFVSATMVTMVFALPPLIRLTNLGIRQVPEDVVEASRAYGASERRVLTDVQLPLARAAILTGINQTLLLAISMLGIAAIMGAGGLGRLLYRAIANQDIALAGSGGLAFFIVAVVLDRLTQPNGTKNKGLAPRIIAAWQNTKTPELLIPARASEDFSSPDDTTPVYAPLEIKERKAIMLTTIGIIGILFALLLPWTKNSGLVSAYARSADTNLLGQSFNGIEASGGSWTGILLIVCAVVGASSVYSTIRYPGRGNRWLGPDGAVLASLTALVLAVTNLLTNQPDAVTILTRGLGAYIAVVSAFLMALGSILWLWQAPMGATRPLPSGVRSGRLISLTFGLLFIVMGGYSGWTFDTRAESVIGPDLQARLDAVELLSRQAEAAGDLGKAGSLAAEYTAMISQAQRTGDVIFDGFTRQGAGLGWIALILGLIALACALPASGLFSREEDYLYRWCTIVGGLGLGLFALAVGWIASITRVADPNLVSGVGSLFVLLGGVSIASSVRQTLAEFTRKEVYEKV
ncbi:MAG: glycine betaine/proline transport system permease protein [Candidatus Poriferisodalaceae bacterium]|jgi:glycine betaine/proline transport system permease protein|tara:strand:- start:393 stop:2675 length:2283 start_codon:yes stop_codon:yes gene_type:complete